MSNEKIVRVVRRSDSMLSRIEQRDLFDMYLLRFDRPQTRRAYRNDLEDFAERVFLKKTLEPEDVRMVSFVEINTYLEQLEQEGKKPTTRQRRLACIRGFFEWLTALGVISVNPANRQLVRKIQKTSYKDKAIIFLPKGDAKKLLKTAKEHPDPQAAARNHALINVLLHCVLRRSEAAAMDVHHIRRSGPYHILILPDTKGGADQYVKIPDSVVEIIERHKEMNNITSGALWRSLSNNSLDKRLSTNSIYEIVKQTAKRAALVDSVGAHTLRHTGCTLAIEAGASVQQVQQHARHKSIDTTMVYVHQQDRLRNSAADFIQIDEAE